MDKSAGDRALETARKILSDPYLPLKCALTEGMADKAVKEVAALIQSAMNAAMKNKELGLIEHFKNAVNDGCVCGVCEAVRAAMNAQEREPKSLWLWPIEEIKSAMRQFQAAHPGKMPSEVEAERMLAERGEGTHGND